MIRIGIADTGLGIKRTINKSYNAADDLEAIKLALVPGITGTTKKQVALSLMLGRACFS
ncbi:MAG: hypothetical protein U9M92_01575 [Patescibacteria group bacterium]|nr:hypothetical protein [Patescibacteria group bacterium]